ncbi:MAG: hypothetical protein ACHQ4H_13730, partial [Ktedonobacterales bacterium]
MAWNARFVAGWRGEVSDADLLAMFASLERLTSLQQALEDRRRAAEIEHAGVAWRAALAVGSLAAPVWLADALVGLAGTFYDADTKSRPDHPATVSPYTHDFVLALLAPVADIIADVTAGLADPRHRLALTSALRVGPGGALAAVAPPDPLAVAYLRGLASGARRVHTSAAMALAALQSAATKAPSPDWLAAGIRRLDGELQAAGARLDMDETRLVPLDAHQHGGDPAALAPLCRDLWGIVASAVVAGQMLADPHLMSEAIAAGATSSTAPQPAAPAAPTSPMPPTPAAPRPVVAPRAPVVPVPHLTLPRIAPGAAPLHERRDAPEQRSAADGANVTPEAAGLALPEIGASPAPEVSDPPLAARHDR